ncbi:hypothetical protein ACIGXM_34470 [Kitasatospora sp. NPDC052896]|uniref:hypothetical protein n=1 Tax=Kitasatospora sp. NPDC052896 TaxID=3364061 RepID=UPI0037C5F633
MQVFDGWPPASGPIPSPVARPARPPVGYVLAVVLFGLLGAAVDALFSFGMLFATDSCGTGSAGAASPVCTPAVWASLLVLPWAGLAAGVLVAALGAVRRRRRGRSPWLALPAGGALYVAVCAVTYVVIFS